MNFSTKEIFLIIVFLIIVAVGFFYWQKAEISRSNKETLEQIEKDCLDKYDKMAESEFLEAIKDVNLKLPFKLELSETEEKVHQIHKAKIDYLTCRVKYGKDEGFYNMAKEYIANESGLSDETKKNTLDILDEAYLGERGFTTELALGDINVICPDKIVNLCFGGIMPFSFDQESEDGKLLDNSCSNVCNTLDVYSKDSSKLAEEVVDFKNWETRAKEREIEYTYRLSIAYRFGGKEMALRVCDNLEGGEEVGKCKMLISYIDGLVTNLPCDEISEDITDLICVSN